MLLFNKHIINTLFFMTPSNDPCFVAKKYRDYKKAVYDINARRQTVNELEDLLDTQNRISEALMLLLQKDSGEYEQEILRIILSRYCADRAYIFQFNWHEQTSSNIFEVVANGITPQIANLQHIPNAIIKDSVELFRQGRPFIVNTMDELGEKQERQEKYWRIRGYNPLFYSRLLFPINCGAMWDWIW